MTFEERNETGLSPDDPRITAYAFGELEGEERAAVEAVVAGDPALRAAVAELRAFGGELGATLAGELEAEPAGGATGAVGTDDARSRGHVLRFPAWAWAAAGFAAAAGVAVLVSLQETAPPDTKPLVAAAPRAGAAASATASPVAPEVGFTVPSATSAFQPAPPLAPVEVQPGEQEWKKLLAAGRSQYLAGDLDKAQESFRAAEYFNAPQPEAGYFLRKIAEEKAKLGTLNREKTRAQMQAEVAKGWQHPGVASGTAGTSVTPVSVSSPEAASEAPPAVFGVVHLNSPPPAAAAAPAPPPAAPAMPPGRAGLHGYAGAVPVLGEVPMLGHAFAYRGPEGGSTAGEAYAGIRENGFVAAEAAPLSTFSIDVDTASYANVRRFLQGGSLPPRDAVRIEELINYFPYRYAPPDGPGGAPFAANLTVASAPWAPGHRLVRIGIKGRELGAAVRPAANLVFLIDVSGSMNSENKLPLVKASLRQLLGQLRDDDRVAIVTYAGASGLALPSTPAARGGEILDALDRLESGGSTNGGMGIHLAYDIAKANFVADGLNRVILCTDGDFNVGVTGHEELLALIQEKARSRVFLTVLGFGMGNLKDGTLEQLADKGNGAYGYIDSRREARKVFVEQVEGTLATIAKDVKIQVEFNPARVASYRLIGYENRALAKEDFNNDKVDAGEVGAGHTVTALYEIVPTAAVAGDDPAPEVDPLKYGPKKAGPARRPAAPAADQAGSDELLTVKIRYKEPAGDVSRKLEFPLVDKGTDFAAADGEFKFAAAVAAWGMLLRESPHAGTANIERVLAWAEDGLGHDPQGHRAEFIELVRRSRGLRE